MEEFNNDLNYVSNDVKQYVQSEIQLGKMELIDQVSHYTASIFSRAVMVTLGVVSYFLMLLSLGFYLNQFFDELWMGLATAFGLSLIVLGLVVLFNKYILKGPIQDLIIAELSKKLLS